MTQDENKDTSESAALDTEVQFSTEDAEAVAAGTAETAWNQGTSPAAADREAADSKGTLDEHPELLAAGAFVGGLVVAMVLRKLGGDDG